MPKKIIYTHTDEAPALATQSLLPIVRAFAGTAGVELELRDISLAGRVLAQFPERLADEQRVADALTELGELAKTPEANIIKLPNISASVPQLKAAVRELQEQGYNLPDYPDEPSSEEEREVRERYDRVKGSAVNPVLREGNSDRRAPASVKEFARRHPHSMGAWSRDSRSHVATMSDGDFRSTERSVTLGAATEVRIEHVARSGETTVLRESLPLLEGEVIDASVMRVEALRRFLVEQMEDARRQGVLYSLHLKATMMKVSDPIIFGHAVSTFLPDLKAPDWNPNDGLGALPEGTEIPWPEDRPALAMV
ncbi:MAG TPA: NADP-dependent isocitrate dehydrogenase, partial [Solirubrobacteraceae bacterium]|nr:NADP-dependent isocitrate dehydrogenase [Solirubrobacteraceae bacterium]